MAEAPRPLDTLQDLGKAWAGTAALATVVVYALGYLSLRSHYTAFGIDVDLGVLDDRYLFAGARFLVFTLVNLASLVVPLLLLAVVWHTVRRAGAPPALSAPSWLAGGLRLVLLGLLALASVTFAQVLLVNNLLLGQRFPSRAWLADQLVCWLATGPSAPYLVLTFKLLLLVTGLTIAWAWREERQPSPARRGLAILLWLLAALELVQLPIYHGIFFADTIVRRLTGAPAGIGGLDGDVWLVYRGKENAMLFGHDPGRQPRLVAVDAAVLDKRPLVGVAHIGTLLEIGGCAKP